MKRILLLGASGTGTTSTAAIVSQKLGIFHGDSDYYFWEPTDPPFEKIRSIEVIQSLLRQDLEKHESFVLSGSFCEWGDMIIPYLDHVFFLQAPVPIRIQRLKDRESARFGKSIEPGQVHHGKFMNFLKWSEAYDSGGVSRTRKLHEDWLADSPTAHTIVSTDQPQSQVIDTILKILMKLA